MNQENSNYEQSHEASEGEIFLQEFFNSELIKYETEVKLPPLKDDNKAFRIADFYLPRYNVFVEFLGRWNTSEEYKNKYRDKMKVYEKNKIPCIFIFPENLGIIHYSFRYRLRQVLKKYNRERELFKYNLDLLLDDRPGAIVWLLIAIILLVITILGKPGEWYIQSIIGYSVVVVFQIYRLFMGYQKFFLKNYSYVNFARE